jgi:hypothetical protein
VEIAIPLFSATDSVDAALDALREHGRAAVVVEADGANFLLYGGSLENARADGIATLAEVRDRHALPARAVAEPPRPAFAAVGDEADAFPTPFMLLRSAGAVAIVATHEWSYDDLALPGVYECDRVSRHRWPPGKATDGMECTRCRKASDGSRGTVRRK